MAFQPVSSPPAAARGSAAGTHVSAGALTLAAAIPILFVHEVYQPGISPSIGGTDVGISLADLAIAVVVGLAVVAAVRTGVGPLVRGRWLFVAGAVLCVLAVASVATPVLRDEPYAWRDRLVAALGFVEYALLAPCVPLLARRRREQQAVLAALILTCVVATAWAVLQFAGIAHEFYGRRPSQREPSFIGYHDFSALAGLVLVVALVVLLTRVAVVRRSLAIAAGIAGALGMVLAGALTGVLGLWLAGAALAFVAVRRHGAGLRRIGAVAAIVVLVTAGATIMRGDAIEAFAGFLGIRPAEQTGQVESYAQRTVLAYIGLRIFLDHPLLGSGFQASGDEFAYGPHLEAARARFPDQPDRAFPSPEHPWGVQNLPIQALADWGVVGLAIVLVVFGLGLWLGLGASAGGVIPLVGAGGILVAAGIWNGLGIVPAIPLAAMTWLSFGLAASDG